MPVLRELMGKDRVKDFQQHPDNFFQDADILHQLTGSLVPAPGCPLQPRLLLQAFNEFGMTLGQGFKDTDEALGHVGMKAPELGGHVGKGSKAVCVEIFVPHFQNVVLDGADDYKDYEAS